MVDWFAGKRVRGTSSERTPLGVTLGGTGVGGWVELGRTTLGSAGDTITVSSLADKRYYMVLWDAIPTGDVFHEARLNADTGSNYATRFSTDGGADGFSTSQTVLSNGVAGGSTPAFHVGYWANFSTKEKLGITHSVGQSTAGATTAPIRREIVGKHAQTSNPINEFQMYNSNTGDYNTGSEVVVLGWDPADTHTNNFWQELASSESAGGDIDTGTFTAKKYLWLQWYYKATGGTVEGDIRVGNATVDSGSNYARRQSSNGGTDATVTSENRMITANTTIADGTIEIGNMFIINNASNEKLAIAHITQNLTAGAGTAPTRKEAVFKWANTSNQINRISLLKGAGTGSIASGSILKVWGAD